MSILKGKTISYIFYLRRSNVVVVADSTPTGTLLRNGADTTVATTITYRSSDKSYLAQALIPDNWDDGDAVHLRISTSVSGTPIVDTYEIGTIFPSSQLPSSSAITGLGTFRFMPGLRYNADLILSKETGATTADPITGNLIPTITKVTLSASVNEQQWQNLVTQMPGFNLSDSFIRGYLLQTLPSGYKLAGVVDMRLIDTVSNTSIYGELSIKPTVTDFLNEIIDMVGGRPFEGIFRMLETS